MWVISFGTGSVVNRRSELIALRFVMPLYDQMTATLWGTEL
jgi:hypothetical protein